MTPIEHLQQRAKDLHLYGLLAHWHELADSGWVEQLLIWEETERAKRSLERRLGSAHRDSHLLVNSGIFSQIIVFFFALTVTSLMVQ